MNSSLIRQWVTGAALLAGAAMSLPVGAGPGAQAQAESTPAIAVTGTLEVQIIEDSQRHHAEQAYFVHEHGNNRLHELEFKSAPAKPLHTGQRVTLRGRAKGHKFQVEEALTTTGNALSPSADMATEAAPPLDPQRHAVVLLVDLLDAKASTRYTPDQIASLMYTGTRSVAELYSQASLGQLQFVADSDNNGAPDVFGPFTIDYSAAQNCDYHAWAEAAENAAVTAGIDLSRYQHRVFVLPYYMDLPYCGWAGIATVGCDPASFCRAWIAEGDVGIWYAHELGHNLNLAHAGTDSDNDGVINQVYGDYSDPMGSSTDWHLFNAPHVDQMNWYAGYPGSIVTVTESGTYDIAVLDTTPPTGPRILKLTKPDNQGFYYVSYRQPTGYDDSLTSLYTRGVSIHRYPGSGYNPTAFITSLADTGKFTDDSGGIEIIQVSHTSDHATVNINLCTTEKPTVTLAPSSRSVKPGATLAYDVTVTNKDSAGCAPTLFYLSYTGLGGGTLVPNSLSLQPGASGSATLQLATAGFASSVYTLQVQAADADGVSPTHTAPGTADATLIIDGNPPTAPTGLEASETVQGHIQLNWSAAADALTGIQSYTVYRDGTVLGQTTLPSYIDTTILRGTRYQYAVAATDGVGNVSPVSAPIIVTTNSNAPGKCTAISPLLTSTPSNRIVQPGAAVTYSVALANRDNSDCAPTTFTLNYTGAPAGTFEPTDRLTLQGGGSGPTTLRVNTTLQDGVLADGSYTLEIRAADEDGNEPNHATVTSNTTLIVDGIPPTTPTGLLGAPTPEGWVLLSWNAATDALSGVQSYRLYRDNEAIAGTNGLSYIDTTGAIGTTHRYTIAAVDKAGNSSPLSAPIQVFNGCEPANATVSLTPSTRLVKAGSSVDYTITVNNADGGGCTSTVFVLNYTGLVPVRLGAPLLVLPGGRSGSTTLAVDTVSQGTALADGSYTLQVQAADNDGRLPDHPAATGSATIIVDGTPPTVPANLQGAIDVEGNISLSWSASMDTPAGVQAYRVYRDGVLLGEATGLSYTDTNTAPNVNYRYTVIAVDKVGNVSAPAAISLGHGCWVAAPTLTLTPASQVVKKNAAAGYQITLVNQDSGLQCQPITFTLRYSGTAAATLAPTQLTLGTGQSGTATLQVNTAVAGSFALEVQAADSDGVFPDHATIGRSATIIIDGAAPTAPKGLQGSADAQGAITLTWNASTDDLSGVQYYTIFRDGAAFDQSTDPSYIDTSAIPGTTYKYAVSATDRAGNVSGKSPAIDVFDGCSPKNPTVTLAPSTQAVLPDVTAGYTVTISNQDNPACTPTVFTLSYKGSPSGTLATTLLTLNPGRSDTTTLVVNKTSSGSSTLEVKAEDKDSVAPTHGPVTGKANFIVDGIAPTTPPGLQAITDSSGIIQLIWSDSTDTLSGVKNYTVYRSGVLLVPQTTELNFIDTTAVLGTPYQYAITATDNLGNVSSPATIDVVSGCMVANPTLTLTPLSNPLVKPGTTIDYEVQVGNQDSQYCPETTFTLSYTGTPTATLAQSTLTLAGGRQAKTRLSVDTTGLDPKNYTLKVQAADLDNAVPAHSAVSGSAVLGVDATPPTVPTGLQVRGASEAEGWIALSWQPATDANGVQGYIVYRDGNSLGQTTELTYTDATVATGIVYRYTVAALDTVGNLSSPSTPVQMLLGCAPQTPQVTLSPSLQMVKKDVATSYTVTVTNQDGANCPATSFTLSYSGAPGGTSLTPTTLMLGIGQSGSATLKLKTGSSASYTLQVNAADNDGNLPSHATGTGSATFISDDSKPTTPTGLKAIAAPGQVALTWNASTDTLSGMQNYSVYRNNILLAETSDLNYTDTTTVKGTNYEYKVAAKDRVGNVSALSAGVKVTGQ
ncbi:MAG: hypothetical protein U1F76_28610 [Candidatus Competibacteraceae bacterium]